MNKKRKILLFATYVLLLLVIGVLTQSLYRQYQRNQVVASIKESVAQTNSKQSQQKALVNALNENKSEIEFVRTHPPILNIDILQSQAQDSDLCDLLVEDLMNHEELYPGTLEIMTILGCSL